jgi:hypothetical protein
MLVTEKEVGADIFYPYFAILIENRVDLHSCFPTFRVDRCEQCNDAQRHALAPSIAAEKAKYFKV